MELSPRRAVRLMFGCVGPAMLLKLGVIHMPGIDSPFAPKSPAICVFEINLLRRRQSPFGRNDQSLTGFNAITLWIFSSNSASVNGFIRKSAAPIPGRRGITV